MKVAGNFCWHRRGAAEKCQRQQAHKHHPGPHDHGWGRKARVIGGDGDMAADRSTRRGAASAGGDRITKPRGEIFLCAFSNYLESVRDRCTIFGTLFDNPQLLASVPVIAGPAARAPACLRGLEGNAPPRQHVVGDSDQSAVASVECTIVAHSKARPVAQREQVERCGRVDLRRE